MALAILKYHGRSGGSHQFEADIGTSQFYRYRLGKSKRDHKGLALLDEVVDESALLKAPSQNPRSFQTSFRFEIPADRIDKDSRMIQLTSFRTSAGIAPAFSEVLEILPMINELNEKIRRPMTMTLAHNCASNSKVETENAPCLIKDKTRSEAMFFNAILGALPGLLTKALPAIGKIIPNLQTALPAIQKVLPELGKIIPSDIQPGKEGANQVLQNISPDTLKAIMEVVQAITAKSDNSVASDKAEAKSLQKPGYDFTINPATLMQLAPLLEKVLSPEAIKAIGDNPYQLANAIADSAAKLQQMQPKGNGVSVPAQSESKLDKTVQSMALRVRNRRNRYSEAKVAPALLAALPALMPLLEKVANPEMIKAIGEQPLKLFEAVANAGLKHQKQELDHLEKINPGVDDPGFDAIVATMSAKASVTVKARFNETLNLQFNDVKTVRVGGKDKVVYDRRQKIHFPITISAKGKTSKITSIDKVIFQLIIQDAESMTMLLEKKFKLRDLSMGGPVAGIFLGTDELKRLPVNRDLKLELSMNWKNGDKIEGTFKNHYVYLSDGYLFQRTGNNIKRRFVLNDVSKFRNYWHKLWEGGPETHERWRIDLECKYYYVLNETGGSIRKLSTNKKITGDTAADDGDDYRRKITAKLKSGTEVSVVAYNELLALHGHPVLTPAHLSAFLSQEFAREAATAARVSVDFKGRRGDTAALWTYPEGYIQSYILSKATRTEPSGMISELQEEEVFFPKFSSIHFIGTKSE